MAWEIAVGGWIVREYINICEVVAMVNGRGSHTEPKPWRGCVYDAIAVKSDTTVQAIPLLVEQMGKEDSRDRVSSH